MTAFGILLAGAGAVLVFSGVKGYDVRDVLASVFDPSHPVTGKRGK